MNKKFILSLSALFLLNSLFATELPDTVKKITTPQKNSLAVFHALEGKVEKSLNLLLEKKIADTGF